MRALIDPHLHPACCRLGLGIIFAKDRVSCHAFTLGGTALFFWLWAMYKVLTTGDHDFGALTFLLVLLAALTTSSSSSRGYDTHDAKIARASAALWRLGSTSCVVCANYGLVLLLVDVPPTFTVYLILGSAWWACAALWTCSALWSNVRSLRSSGGVDHEAEMLVEANENLESSLASKARVFLFQ